MTAVRHRHEEERAGDLHRRSSSRVAVLAREEPHEKIRGGEIERHENVQTRDEIRHRASDRREKNGIEDDRHEREVRRGRVADHGVSPAVLPHGEEREEREEPDGAEPPEHFVRICDIEVLRQKDDALNLLMKVVRLGESRHITVETEGDHAGREGDRHGEDVGEVAPRVRSGETELPDEQRERRKGQQHSEENVDGDGGEREDRGRREKAAVPLLHIPQTATEGGEKVRDRETVRVERLADRRPPKPLVEREKKDERGKRRRGTAAEEQDTRRVYGQEEKNGENRVHDRQDVDRWRPEIRRSETVEHVEKPFSQIGAVRPGVEIEGCRRE